MGLLNEVPGPIICQQSPLLAELAAANAELAERLDTALDPGSRTIECAQAVCGISAADALLASSGSILLRSSTAGGRRLSVLVPLHIVVATSVQLVRTSGEWLSAIAGDDSWSLATIISGPSRTSDIEKTLVLGAHGPKRLALLVIEQG